MSLNVLIVPENFRKDQFVLKPIVEAMFEEIGVRATVRVCMDPAFRGVGDVLEWDRLLEVIERYRGMTRFILLLVDRDGDAGRRDALDHLEASAAATLAGATCCLLAENAWQEVEVWVLAGLRDLPKAWTWRDVRADLHPKENYFDPYAAEREVDKQPDGGRAVLAQEAARRYRRIRQLCPEDVHALERRVRERLTR